MRTFLVIVFAASFFILDGCKKNDSGPTGDQNQVQLTVPTVTFKGPNTTSSDSHAQQAKGDATSMGGLMTMASVFAQTPAQQNGNTYTWTFSSGTYTETFTGVKQSDGSYVWSFVLNGQLTGDTAHYNNFKMWEGTTSADGKSGSWKFYEFGYSYAIETLDYSTDAQGALTGTFRIYSAATTVAYKWVMVNNADGSGSDIYYQGDTKMVYKITWTSTGTGQWWTYGSDGVTVTSQGNW